MGEKVLRFLVEDYRRVGEICYVYFIVIFYVNWVTSRRLEWERIFLNFR